jgi:hypothetical protein
MASAAGLFCSGLAAALALQHGQPTNVAKTISGVSVYSVPLRRSDPDAPFCHAVTMDGGSSSIVSNDFLATQVWPSARFAASTLEQHLDLSWTVCELGCGPGLPSLTAAKIGSRHVIATDVHPFPLELVKAAARSQELSDRLSTQLVDLTNLDQPWPVADLYIMSDVFESASVAGGAAVHTQRALEAGKRVWVFCQSDRAQRAAYLEALRQSNHDLHSLNWSPQFPGENQQIWLCDVDETLVSYG